MPVVSIALFLRYSETGRALSRSTSSMESSSGDPREFAEGVAERAERERYGNPPLSAQNGPVGAHAEGDGLYESDVRF